MIKISLLFTMSLLAGATAIAQTIESSSAPAKGKVLVTVTGVRGENAFSFLKEDGSKIRFGCGNFPKDLSDSPSQQATQKIFTSTYLD